jgi:hypothetical protein
VREKTARLSHEGGRPDGSDPEGNGEIAAAGSHLLGKVLHAARIKVTVRLDGGIELLAVCRVTF